MKLYGSLHYTSAVIAGLLRMIIWIQVVAKGDLTDPFMMVLGTYLQTADQEGVTNTWS